MFNTVEFVLRVFGLAIATTLLSTSAWAGGRAGLAVNAYPPLGVQVGPDAAVRMDLPGAGLHIDIIGLYHIGPTTDFQEFLQEFTGVEADLPCFSEMPRFLEGYSTVDGRGVVGVGPVKVRVGVSTQIETGFSNGFMEHLINECAVATDGPTSSLSLGPSVGILVNAGPMELTTDLVFRAAILANDPYKYGDIPAEEQWVRKGTDYVPTVLLIPLRAAVELGPGYVRAGIAGGVAFPTKNRKLIDEQYPLDPPQALLNVAGQLDVAAGIRF